MHEAELHERNCFVTLTYSDQELPADRSVNPRHWQLFAKRMRKAGRPFRFYHCGEYGERTQRPHYHALIFGQDFLEDRKLERRTARGHHLFASVELDKLWRKGHCYIGELTPKSAGYVARYAMKKLGGVLAEETYGERVDQETGQVDFYRHPPYATMSRRPGIGQEWLNKFQGDVFPSDEVIVNGRKTRVPRYYDEQLDPGELEVVKGERRKRARRHKKNNSSERLTVREECLERKLQHYNRDAL